MSLEELAERRHCAYCEAPLPGELDKTAPRQAGPSYCCYGCRILGEAARKPVATETVQKSPWFKIAIGAVLAGQAMLLGLAVNLSPPAGTTRWLLHASLILSSLAALVILGRPLLQSALAEIRQRRVSTELLFLAGIAGAFGASICSTVSGAGSVYYEVVAVLLTVYSVGKTLGAQSRARALAETRHLQRTFETCQRISPDGSVAAVRVAEIRAGDQVRVRAGEPIPIDGSIIQGVAFVCETPLTGEPFPVVRRVGDAVLAGSYSEDGELWIRATAHGTARRLDGLLAELEQARERPCRMQAQADEIVRWFLPLVLSVSLATFLFWTRRSGWPAGLFNALAVLLVACPCAMGLATPVALWSALAALAARGLVARGGDVVDRLAGLDRMIFDKTGTLSQERHSLIDLAAQGSAHERQAILAQLEAVQEASSHPVARAFQRQAEPNRKEAAEQNPFRVRSFKTIPALGVEAWIESDQGAEHFVRIGQRELMSDLTAEGELLGRLRHAPHDHLVYVEADGRLGAIAAVRERLRDSAAEAMRLLEEQGIACAVMTGDRPERARELLEEMPNQPRFSSQSLFDSSGSESRLQPVRLPTNPIAKVFPSPRRLKPGLQTCSDTVRAVFETNFQVQGSLTPLEKASRIGLAEQGGLRAGFVGDGVNDAPAMRAASVGIALAHGAGVTTAGADAVLYGGDLRVVPWAVALARQVRSSIRSNLLFAAVYNIFGMALAAAGLLHPVASALLMVVSSFTVCWRALRSTESLGLCCVGPGKTIQTTENTKNTEIAENGTVGWFADWLRTPSVSGRSSSVYSAYSAVPNELLRSRSGSRFQIACGLLLIAQVPFLIYLGRLGLVPSLMIGLAFLALGLCAARFRTSNLELSRLASMTIAMLGPGNWGMLLGWWADAGFVPPHMACSCCAAHGFSLLGFMDMPWMNAGMLLLGLPPMILDPTSVKRGLSRFSLALLSAAGMVWGMSFGSHVFLAWFGPLIPHPFLLSFTGMTIGMLLGMFLCCEFGRALSLALGRKN